MSEAARDPTWATQMRAAMNAAAGQSDGDLRRRSVRLAEQRHGALVRDRRPGSAPAASRRADSDSAEVAGTVEQPERDDRDAEVAGRLAGGRRRGCRGRRSTGWQGGRDAVLRREVRDRAPVPGRQRLVPAGRTSRYPRRSDAVRLAPSPRSPLSADSSSSRSADTSPRSAHRVAPDLHSTGRGRWRRTGRGWRVQTQRRLMASSSRRGEVAGRTVRTVNRRMALTRHRSASAMPPPTGRRAGM